MGGEAAEEIEIRLLLDAVFSRYGYDFTDYSRQSVKKRIRKHLEATGLSSVSALQHAILYDAGAFARLLSDLTVNVTEMFRDHLFYRCLKADVLPLFDGQPFLKVWHAGCATGEEVYSVAIFLKEAGLLSRCRIYATDTDAHAIRAAQKGAVPLDRMRQYTRSYIDAGGTGAFSDYYEVRHGLAFMDPGLLAPVVFSDHNLAMDGVFGEMDLIFCRNVLIYFNRHLQDRVLTLFADSLVSGGILCLGANESLRLASCRNRFDHLFSGVRIFQKR